MEIIDISGIPQDLKVYGGVLCLISMGLTI